MGKEVVLFYSHSKLDNDNEFWTDSNGRQFIKRVKDKRLIEAIDDIVSAAAADTISSLLVSHCCCFCCCYCCFFVLLLIDTMYCFNCFFVVATIGGCQSC